MFYVIAGMLNEQIADELGISEGTVKIHRGRVMHKLGIVADAWPDRSDQASVVCALRSAGATSTSCRVYRSHGANLHDCSV